MSISGDEDNQSYGEYEEAYGLLDECEHESMRSYSEGRGERWECPDCGATGWNSDAAMYGVSDADFM